eukprot:7389230-Prymnesium_polylepis.1
MRGRAQACWSLRWGSADRHPPDCVSVSCAGAAAGSRSGAARGSSGSAVRCTPEMDRSDAAHSGAATNARFPPVCNCEACAGDAAGARSDLADARNSPDCECRMCTDEAAGARNGAAAGAHVTAV